MSGQKAEAFIPASETKLWCGYLDCSSLTSWRGGGSNRTLWKSICTLCLLAEFGVFVWTVQPRVVMLLIVSFTVLKLFAETWGQDTPSWVCPGGPVMFVIVYFLALPSFIWAGGNCTQHLDILFPYKDAVGFVLFVFGSVYSLWYEVHRFQWKKDPSNKGKLHTIGLARYCIHPNYFGDLFTYTGWAICAGTTCALSVPVFMPFSFIVLVNPNSEAYLESRYSDEWPGYAAQTATLIPGLKSKLANQVLAWCTVVLSCCLSASCSEQCAG